MTVPYHIIELDGQKKWKQAFIDCPWNIYQADSFWVPPLRLTVEDILSPSHPFYQTAKTKSWVALSQGKVLGRIMAIINQAHNDFHHEKCGMFGFFEVIEHAELANDLLTVATHYLHSEGMTHIRGPYHPSVNYECGLLVDGYQDAPQIMMTYNPPYYQTFLENFGFNKAKDLWAYRIPIQTTFPPILHQIDAKLRQRYSITVRTLSLKHWEREVALMEDIYRSAWENNWGYVPMTQAEFSHMAKQLKSIVNEQLCLFVEVNGEVAGFLVAVPDFHQILKKIPDGKLFPWGLRHVLFGKKSIDRARILTLGIKKSFRHLGLSTTLFIEIKKRFEAFPQYKEVEMSWILEDNGPMNRPLEKIGAQRYKTYRLYERELNS
jgi:hypothetical protein